MTVRLLLIGAAMVLAGCASSGPKGSEVLTGSINPAAARLVIYRSNPLGFAIQPDYTVNGKKIGISTPKGFVVFELPPGRHNVAVSNLALNINFGGGVDKWDLNLKPGTTTYLQAEPKMGLTVGVITLTQVTDVQGRNETADLHQLNGTC